MYDMIHGMLYYDITYYTITCISLSLYIYIYIYTYLDTVTMQRIYTTSR